MKKIIARVPVVLLKWLAFSLINAALAGQLQLVILGDIAGTAYSTSVISRS